MKKLFALLLLLTLSLAIVGQQGMGPGPGVKTYSAGVTTFVNDTFTDPDSTTLASHTGETGATWTQHPSFVETFAIISNRARKNSATASAEYTASGVAGSLNYTVEVVLVDTGTAVSRSAGGCGWVDTAADDAICVRRVTSTSVELIKIIGATGTQQDSAAVTFSAGTSHTLQVTRTGDNFEWWLDGVSQGTVTISDSAFQAANLPNGVGWVAVRASNDHTVNGYHIDRITAWF